MEAKLMDRIKEQLVRYEGLRLKPYRCTTGKLTIGIGRNLDFVIARRCHRSNGFTQILIKLDSNQIPVLLSYLYPNDELSELMRKGH